MSTAFRRHRTHSLRDRPRPSGAGSVIDDAARFIPRYTFEQFIIERARHAKADGRPYKRQRHGVAAVILTQHNGATITAGGGTVHQ